MSLITLLLLLFFILGISMSPLFVGVAIATFSQDRSRGIAEWSLRTGLKSIYKPAITFNAEDELFLKRRRYDEKHGMIYVSFGGLLSGVKRYLYDRQDRVHSLLGVPFCFIDEKFGVVFDPRDVDLGRELRLEQENGSYTHRVERGNKLLESVKAVFETPRGSVGVHLPEIWRLIGGSTDAKILDTLRDIYEKSQEPRAQTTAFRQMLIPIGTFIAIILLGIFTAGKGGGGGGGGGSSVPETSINFGILLLLASMASWREMAKRVNWRDVAIGVVIAGIALGFSALLLLALPTWVPILGIPLPLGAWAVIAYGVGLVLPAFVASWFGRSLGTIGMALGKLYVIIGLYLGWRRPVIYFDEGEYRVEEYADRSWRVEPKWYRFAMSRVGIAFDNREENWPHGTTLSRAQVNEMGNAAELDGEVAADGGSTGGASWPSPAGHTATDLIAVDDIRGFVPNDPDDHTVFVRTDRTTGWLYEAGQDRRLLYAALLSAKRDFEGGKKPVGDKWIMGASIVMALLAVFINVVVFW